ncbi:transcriptional regulator, GntR family [Salinispora tropica CNB-440]|uniref:Transcriptional regulator, GntR family n=1 Tax=Salinispora tropica (strain ATCC BAA-916 / DSM 44818 / JCM 13857 / NBRC 105044 / CNB-440) TaxID=369723 RepID=A4XBS6_SALTO|nr:transcriptional regulator, GntR family [Salinispora tropica CNB-440]
MLLSQSVINTGRANRLQGASVPIPPTMNELISDLLKRIEVGELRPGSQIPSTQELSDHYDLSLSTIHRAVARLREQGVLVGRPGRGVFVAERPQH